MKHYMKNKQIYGIIGIVFILAGLLLNPLVVQAEENVEDRETLSANNYEVFTSVSTDVSAEDSMKDLIIADDFMDTSADMDLVIELQNEDPDSYIRRFIERMYTIVLGREAEEEGLNSWVNQLVSQTADGASIARGFVCSKEFINKNVNNETYLYILYRTFLDREPDSEGMATWMSCLESGESRTKVLSGFVNSKEFGAICETYGIARGTMEPDGSNIYSAGVRQFVSYLYSEVLGRNGDIEGIENWTYLLNKNRITPEECAKGFFNSPEYLNRNVPDEEFVETLYRTFLGRTSDSAGKADWIKQLQSGTSRDTVIAGFANSIEFRKIYAKYTGLPTNTNVCATPISKPFLNPSLGNGSFRIPAMVSLNNGTIVAAADARWDSQIDGDGTDTIVSISSDFGNSWNQSYANSLGKNGIVYDPYTASFIDPALATDGNTVYLLVDLMPSCYAFYGSLCTLPESGVGFDQQGRLMLRGFGELMYNYYLQNGEIYSKSGEKVEGYTVDGLFNIHGKEGDSNLFNVFDSPFTVYPTEYLYLTKSTDGGRNWSAPKLLNVKQMYEQGYSVGCGRGTILSDGTILFPCYKTIQGIQIASFIYSVDNGTTWNRAPDATESHHPSSESVIVELNSKHIRMFYRDGYRTLSFTDYMFTNGSWNIGASGTVPGITKTLYCQLNAIKYNDNTILISMPTSGTQERHTGMIITIELDSSYGMNVTNLCSINGQESFGYSCLSKLSDGSVGILYESSVADNKYEILYKRIKAEDLGIY